MLQPSATYFAIHCTTIATDKRRYPMFPHKQLAAAILISIIGAFFIDAYLDIHAMFGPIITIYLAWSISACITALIYLGKEMINDTFFPQQEKT